MSGDASILDRFRLDGRVAVVTGGSRGIGRGIALALAEAGAELVLISRTAAQLARTAQEVERLGRRVVTHAVDVADVAATGEAIDAAAGKLGRIDVLVNAAGVQLRKPVAEVTPDDFDSVHDVNLRGAYFAAQAALHHMRAGGYGRVINIASLTLRTGLPGITIYGCTKGGVAAMTVGMATEYAPEGITVNAIAPGYIYTDMTAPLFEQPERRAWIHSRIPMRRHGTPDDLAGLAVFLASPASAYLTGQIIYVDGGWTAA